MTALTAVVAIVLWMLTALRVPTLRDGWTHRLVWLALAALASAVTLEMPAAAQVVDSGLGLGPNVATFVKHLLAVGAAGAVLEVVRRSALPPDVARRDRTRRVVAIGSAAVVLVALFVIAPVHKQTLTGFTAAAGDEPALLAYWVVYILVLGMTLMSIGALARRSVTTFPAGPLRTGLSWLGVGAITGLVYCAHKVFFIGSASMGAGPSIEVMERVQTGLMAATLLALVLGVLWPSSAYWPSFRKLRALGTYRRLGSLWEAYQDGLVTPAPIQPSKTSLGDIELQLYQRVIDIRDGMLAVRPYGGLKRRELYIEEARRINVKHAALIGEAAWHEGARRARLRGDPPADEAPADVLGGNDLESECRMLTEIAKAQTRVNAIVDRVEATTDRNAPAL